MDHHTAQSLPQQPGMPALHTIKAITWYSCDDCFDSTLLWTKQGPDVCLPCLSRKDLPPSAARLTHVCFDRVKANHFLHKQQFDLARLLCKATAKYPLGLNTLCAHLQLSDRSVKGYIETLRSQWLLPIGSSKFPPSGYYWISSPDEFKQWLEAYLSQPKEEFRTAHRMLRANFPELAGQINFDFQEQ
jgi:hypothetical protein